MINNRPIVGIMTEPVPDQLNTYGTSFLNADYVKWLEGAGCRVVPVHYNSSHEELRDIFGKINGLLFPGGADIINHTLYYNSSLYMFNLAIQANQAGDYFPLWGTCLGFELLSMMVANGNFSVLSHVDAENISLPLKFVVEPKKTRLFSKASSLIIDALENTANPLTENYHHWGVSPAAFDYQLGDFYRPIAVSQDRQGLPFMATMEAWEYPVYATQWHPERSLFEWSVHEDINHSMDAVVTMQYLSSFFASEVRKNQHKFAPGEAEKYLIYNYAPVYMGRLFGFDEQWYFF
jgi:gamma-glutamyl hydrolase